jgi:Secretion system C-terminal sorting domain
MKKIFLIFSLLILSQAQAQNPINIQITGSCNAYYSGTYVYSGLVNGKNSYSKNFLFQGYNFVFSVAFDNTKWVLHVEPDLAETLFINNTVPAGLLPPSTGWSLTECPDGTMTIEGVLSLNDNNEDKNNLSFYPNPTRDYLAISSTKNSSTSFTYQLIDITGRNVTAGAALYNEKINIANLETGNYIIQIKDENGKISNGKLIKQ